ncbi:MAG: hypothetical protein OXK16_02650 [bacterium]|nr:hypothetical protein [bacterium]
MTASSNSRAGARSERLARVATEDGLFTVLAIDHVGSFAQTVRPDHPESMTAADISAAKQPIIAALGPISGAVLIDPGYLVTMGSTPRGRPDGLGLILGVEDGDYADVRTAPRLLPGWNVERAAEMGADAVKISVYYDPDGDMSAAEHFVTDVVSQCRQAGLPLFCEPLALYEDPGDRTRAVLEGVRRLGPLGAEVLKLQFPVMPGAGRRDPEEWAEACAEVDRLSPVPWVILSEGSDFALFRDQVRVACAAGASGFLGGRAIWRELATGERDAQHAAGRMTELCAVARAEGTAWTTSLARRSTTT